jgi:hypothetical protein
MTDDGKGRSRQVARTQKTILILLDFVGYYLCNLIFHHLQGVGVMSEREKGKSKKIRLSRPFIVIVPI